MEAVRGGQLLTTQFDRPPGNSSSGRGLHTRRANLSMQRMLIEDGPCSCLLEYRSLLHNCTYTFHLAFHFTFHPFSCIRRVPTGCIDAPLILGPASRHTSMRLGLDGVFQDPKCLAEEYKAHPRLNNPTSNPSCAPPPKDKTRHSTSCLFRWPLTSLVIFHSSRLGMNPQCLLRIAVKAALVAAAIAAGGVEPDRLTHFGTLAQILHCSFSISLGHLNR